ncbi:class I SAM-dependent methyltransferase [Noviherbaspirillum aridicola]|uniref:Methyltransferase family protein n=1 Tax=Noviherbaspirillum aridicola TaxID=2849687 RepID=A0ABQ4Q204_9BURK|nr:class I SAM-dependent methyltransferase [Noviherbaspirillum aridicola]GIZ51213.1 hypothetical protein NCCP691_12270 [Noviherbaspirillum aridicola]
MNWTEGYTVDVEYTASFRPEISPPYLSFACRLHGYEAVAADRPFTYMELGCGRGLTASVLAATNPHGRFYGVDFNPAHIAGGRTLAGTAKLDNLTLIEAGFEDLARGKIADLPMFDFITLHGVYSWVSPATRRHIVEFIGRQLKPGGIVYVSYNAMPGWAGALPLQRLLLEHASAASGSATERLMAAAGLAMRLDAIQADYFTSNGAAKFRLDGFRNDDPRYLVHEYLNADWAPLYHADVMREMMAAKLDFVGRASLDYAFPEIVLSPERRVLVAEIADPCLRETCIDYLRDVSFRADIFMLGPKRMRPEARAASLENAGLALVVPRNQIALEEWSGEVAAGLTARIFNAVLDALADGPRTFAELRASPGLAGVRIDTLAAAATLLCRYKANLAVIFFRGAGADAAPALRLNQALLAEAQRHDDFDVLALPSLGSGMPATRLERLVLHYLASFGAPPDLSMLGELMCANPESGTTEKEAEQMAEVRRRITETVESRLPLWRSLGILPP